MKSILLIAVLFASTGALANFNSDVPDQVVTCKGQGFKVSINADRSQIRVADDIDPDHPAVYNVNHRQSDGDTSTTYSGPEISIDPQSGISLRFDDQGDTLTYGGEEPKAQAPLKIKCPRGNN